MSVGGKQTARNLRGQEPGQGERHAIAAGAPKIMPPARHRQSRRVQLAFGLHPALAETVAALAYGDGSQA